MLNTSQTTKTAFEQALLALAAYGEFNSISLECLLLGSRSGVRGSYGALACRRPHIQR